MSGSLATPNEYVGNSAVGTFTESAGTDRITSGSLQIGSSTSGIGTYNLYGGSLIAPSEYLGYSGTRP